MKRFRNDVQGITVFEINGSPIFNVNFQAVKYNDESLMAGFLAGIVAFSQELGSEPTAIELSNARYHVWRENQLIFALRTTKEAKTDQVAFLKTLILSHPLHVQLESLSRENITSPEKKEQLIKILADLIQDVFWGTKSKHLALLNDQANVETLNDIFNKIMNKEARPDYVAEKILATSLKKNNHAFIKQSKQWLQSLLENKKLQLDDTIKTLLMKTIAYLDNEEFLKKRRLIFGPLIKKHDK